MHRNRNTPSEINLTHCNTLILFFSDGELYAGTVADFSATDALIIKKRLRTEQYDLKHLNEPHFVSSLEDDKHVYFFFRESAVEFMNCGKVKIFVSFWAIFQIVSWFS